MTCPRIGSWLNKLWYNHIVIYSAVTGRGDESVCMQLEKRFQNLLLREKKCKVPSSKFNLFSFMQMLSIWMCVCPGVLIGNYPGRILKKKYINSGYLEERSLRGRVRVFILCFSLLCEFFQQYLCASF